MPRHARLRIAGFPLHVIQRGVNRAACFGGENDYGLYPALLDEIGHRCQCSIHAYVLMTNHVHLLVTPNRSDGASNLMKHLGQRYVQYFNRRHGRTGTLWEGRFRSSIVDSAAYLLRCQRYIELNPVRAGMVPHPRDYPWSSFGSNADGKPSPIVTPHNLYLSLGPTETERLASYRELFRDELPEDEIRLIREATNGGFVLGHKAFVANIERLLNRRAARGAEGRPRKQPA